jgi:large subunit ribosomal protein L29
MSFAGSFSIGLTGYKGKGSVFMDLKELRQLTGLELTEKAQQLTQELFNLRFQLGTGRLENPMQVRKTKRSIARVKTLQREQAQADPISTAAKGA